MSEQKMIFIITDDVKIVRRLKLQIKNLGFKIAGLAKSVEEAVEKIGEPVPDIIILDMDIDGDIDGVEAAAIIQRRFPVPVIFLSDKSGSFNFQNTHKSETCRYIDKSSTAAILNLAILNLLDRRRGERRISGSSEQLKAVLNSLGAGICVLDETGTITMTNNQWEKFAADNSGDSGRTGVGINYLQICENTQGEDREAALEFASGIKEILQGRRKNFSKEYACCSPDEERWFRGRVTPLPDISRGTIGAVVSHLNITDFKMLEKEMKEKTVLLDSVIETTPDAVYVKDLNGRYLLVNKSAAEVVGRNAADIIGRDDMSFLNEAEAAAIMKGDRKVIDEGSVQILDEMITVPSGEVRTFLSTKGPIFETNGEKKGIFGVAHDITQRKQMEETLKKNARDIHTLVENASDMIIRYSKDFRYMYCNKAVEHEFGIPVCDYIGRTSLQLGKYEEFGKSNEESLKEVLKNGKEMTVEQRIIFPSGEKWFQKHIVPERNENGEIESFLAISRDITEYKKATDEIKQYQNHLEELVHNRTIELFESEKRYREILNSIADYVYMIKIDKDKIISAVYTDRCYAVTGYQPCEFYDDHSLWLNIVFEEDRRKFKHFIKNILTGQEHSEKNIEHRIITKNGSLRWVRNTVVINKNSDGVMTGYDGVIIDITDLKNAEDEIRQLNLNIINLQEEERQRVSANLHDSVGQTILAAKINIDTYKQDPVFFADQLDVGLSFIIQASRELKEIYTNLYPLVLNDLGFEMAVRWLVGNTLEKMNVKTDINSNITNRLPHNMEVALFRILQEIVSNIIKHASASKVYFSLTCNGNQFELVVKDNGIGFNPGDKKEKISGYGLSNIKYRVIGFNGKLSIGPNYPHGTIIRITIDLSSSMN